MPAKPPTPKSKITEPAQAGGCRRPSSCSPSERKFARKCPIQPLARLRDVGLSISYEERRVLPGPPRMVLLVISNKTGNTVWWDYMTDESTTTPTMWLTWLREANRKDMP